MPPYTPIHSSDREIRLLQLAPGSYNDRLVITLIPAYLKNSPPPQYEALSYVWGIEKSPTPALVNNSPCTITANLDVALRSLRKSNQARILWVDAMCINQDDTEEKKHQVQMMSQIYRMAARVVVWLGPADKTSNMLLDCVENKQTITAGDVEILFKAVSLFSTRPWFSRVWVVQEFCLAQTEAYIFCGQRMTALSHIDFFISRLCDAFEIHKRRIEVGQFPGATQWNPCLASSINAIVRWLETTDPLRAKDDLYYLWQHLFKISGLLKLREDRFPAKDKASGPGGRQPDRRIVPETHRFPYILSKLVHLEATDPIDKIYGLLGLCEFRETPIVPDYTLHASQVYAQAMAAIITDPYSGFVHGFPQWPVGISLSHQSKIGVPSWVPDFSKGSFWVETERQIMGLSQLRRLCDRHAILDAIQATARCFPFVRFTDKYRTMCAGGVEIGTVCDSWFLRNLNADELYDMVDNIQDRGGFKDDIVDALRGADPTGQSKKVVDLQDQEHWGSAESRRIPWGDSTQILEAAATSSPGDYLFLTTTGQVGVTNGKLAKGDLVVGLFGINFPVILRWANEQSFRMVSVARMGFHTLGHSNIPQTATEADLLQDYEFNVYVIH